MVRAKPEDVDLERRTWFVRSAKNEPAHVVYLNDEQVEAWKAFIAADCWGTYNVYWFRTRLRTAGWPAHVSTYNYRHEGAIDALAAGADLGDVQGLLGHTEIETTRRNYGPLVMSRQQAISAKLGRRLERGTDGMGTDGCVARATFLDFFVVRPALPLRAFLRRIPGNAPIISDLALRA
jgi:integrase